MILYGRNAVREAIRAGMREVSHVWALKGAAREAWLEGMRVDVLDSPEAIEERCGSGAHQGICAQAGDYVYADAAEMAAVEDPFVVALDEVQDPQNLGALCRTAEVVGATGVVIPERRSAHVTAAVCAASSGAVEHLPIAQVPNLADFLLGPAKAAGGWCYGASADARVSYRSPDYSGGVVLVLGAEGKGLRPRVAKACDELISLPRRGQIDSLNVSAAGAVLMYEILHSREGA